MNWYLEIAVAFSVAWALVIGRRLITDDGYRLHHVVIAMVAIGLVWPAYVALCVLWYLFYRGRCAKEA